MTVFFFKKLQKPYLLSVRCIQILSLGLGTPPYDKIWFRVCLVKGRQIAECVGLHAMKQIKFCNSLFHFTVCDVARGGEEAGKATRVSSFWGDSIL